MPTPPSVEEPPSDSEETPEEIEVPPDELGNPDPSPEEPSEETIDEESEIPADDPNPLNSAGNSLDTLIQRGINADLWEQMKGDLPCVDATTECITELQNIATQQNPLLQEIDTRIEEINAKIDEAKAANKKSINLSVLRPAARVFLEPNFDAQASPGQRQQGTIEKIAQIFTSPTGVINEVLRSVGIPLFDKLFGGSDQSQERAIAISDLAVKLAEIQRGRAELANQIKEKVALAIFDFDTSRREFQLSQEISKRESNRTQLIEMDYQLGEGESTTYLSQLSSLDRNKAATWKSWSEMRAQLAKLQLLVLGTEE